MMSNSESTTFCRACTKELDNECSKTYLFEETSNTLEMFRTCTMLEINDLDELPAYICEQCNGCMINFHQFQLTCKNSDEYFRQKLLWNSVEVKKENLKTEETKDQMVTLDHEKYLKIEIGLTENECLNSPKITSFNATDNSLECEICGKHFYKKHRLEGHLRHHCGLKAFQCNLCDKSFEKWNRLKSHKREHEINDNAAGPSRQFQCDYENCKKSYNHLKSLRDHIKSYHLNIKRKYGDQFNDRQSRYPCTYCEKKYKKKESLDGHIRQHQGLDPFECKLCGTTFQKLRSLILHNDAKHNEAFQKIPCDYDECDRSFTTKHGLKEHISNIHLGIKKPKVASQVSYVCELCGKSFKNKTSLKKHSYCHTGERPFACSYCPKRFTVKDKLKNHTMRHENIKNFECSYCGMRKVTMAELKIHMNTHTMDTKYPCSQCSAVFSRDGNAKRHFRIVHRGYKPYKCSTCQQSFSKKETLKHHEMTHSGEKPHACSICDKRFIQPIALKKHLNVHSKQATRMAEAHLFNNSIADLNSIHGPKDSVD